MNKKILQMAGLCLGLIVLLSACSSQLTPIDLPANTPSAVSQPASTDTPLPTSTPVPPTATATATFTPTATLHPLTIESMRQRSYPGSALTIEQELTAAANFTRSIVSYQSDGLKIYALLNVPVGDPPPGGWPVIIFNHGYIPPDQYQTTERYVAYVNFFASRGYIVIKPDYRGHGNSEGVPGGAYSSPGYTIDVLNAVGSMRQYPGANPDKIGLWGHSMGGHLTLRSMVVDPGIKVGVIWAGVVGSYPDMMNNWRPTPIPTLAETSRGFSRALVETYGSPEENPDFYDSISPIAFVADLTSPIQIHHSENDHEVPFAFSQSLYDAMTAAGKDVELYAYPGDDHNIANSFSLAMQRSVDFFDRFLK